jgi:hypothetical protein
MNVVHFFCSIPIPIIVVAIVICAVFGIYEIVKLAQDLFLGLPDVFSDFFMIGGSIYFVGNILKFALIGPSFVRWHLSDFGFCIFLIGVFYTLSLNINVQTPEDRVFEKETARNWRRISKWFSEKCRIFINSTVTGFVICVVYEFVSSYMVIATKKTDSGIGKFDPRRCGGLRIGDIIVALPSVATKADSKKEDKILAKCRCNT